MTWFCTRCDLSSTFPIQMTSDAKMREKVSKPTFQHCLRMLHFMHTTIMEGGIGQSGSKPSLL